MFFCFLISKSTKKYRNHIKRLKGWCHPAAPALIAFVIVITKYIFYSHTCRRYVIIHCFTSIHTITTLTVWQCECHEFKCAVTDWLTLIWLLVSLCWTVRIYKKKKSLHLEHKEFNTQREAGVLNRLLVFVDIFSLCSFDVQEHQSSFYTWTLDNNEIIRSGYFQLLSSLSCSTEQEVVHSEDILCVV